MTDVGFAVTMDIKSKSVFTVLIAVIRRLSRAWLNQ